MTKFSDLGLAEKILRAVEAEGYDTPTPIQARVIPAALAGRDVIGIAQTGTGKTASFVLPILHRAVQGQQPIKRGCRSLILTPTRELAGQIGDAIRNYGRHVKPAVATVVGGVRPGPQVRAVVPGVDVIVATPGRLMDHMQAGDIKVSGADLIVLDEADQMLDLGFLPAIRKILAACAPEKQVLLLSATMPSAIRELAGDFLNDPEEISVAPESRPIERIAQRVIHMDHAEKKGALIDILVEENVKRGIVFTRTKRGADRVSKWLVQAGIEAAAIHGDKSQAQRDRALNQFRHGKIHVLVATDVAARGIDIDGVTHVVNYEMPEVAEAYVHRIGRTARAGASGIAISLCCPDELPLLRDIEKITNAPIPAVGEAPTHVPAAPKRGRGARGGQQGQGRGQQGRGQGGQPRGDSRGAQGETRGRSGGGRNGGGQGGRQQAEGAGRGGNGGANGGGGRGPRPARDGGRDFGDAPRQARGGEQARSDKPRSDKPRNDKPRGEKPRGEKPRDAAGEQGLRRGGPNRGKSRGGRGGHGGGQGGDSSGLRRMLGAD